MIYIIQAKTENSSYYKIGYSKCPKERLSQIATGCPVRPKLIFTVATTNDKAIESLIHESLKKYNTHREWFCLTEKQINLLIKTIRSDYLTIQKNQIKTIVVEKRTDVMKPNLFSKEEAIKFINSKKIKNRTRAYFASKGMSWPPKKGWKQRTDKALKQHFKL